MEFVCRIVAKATTGKMNNVTSAQRITAFLVLLLNARAVLIHSLFWMDIVKLATIPSFMTLFQVPVNLVLTPA